MKRCCKGENDVFTCAAFKYEIPENITSSHDELTYALYVRLHIRYLKIL